MSLASLPAKPLGCIVTNPLGEQRIVWASPEMAAHVARIMGQRLIGLHWTVPSATRHGFDRETLSQPEPTES